MLKVALGVGVAAMCVAATPASAALTVLTFDRGETACTATDNGPANQVCTTDGQLIGGNYGSSANLTVSYDASESSGSRRSLQHTSDFFFTSNDGQATSFPAGPADELSSIIFTPRAGYEVSFQSFAWDKLTATTSADFIFRVLDPLGNVIFTAGNDVLTYTVNSAYFAGPVTFQFGNGGRGAVAVDDVAVDVRLAATPGVPEPASWAMMIAGFGLAGAAMRRRQTATVVLA